MTLSVETFSINTLRITTKGTRLSITTLNILLHLGHHDSQPNVIQHNDIQRGDIQHKDTKNNNKRN